MPALSYITNKQRAFVCESTNLGSVDFKLTKTEIVYWNARKLTGSIIYGKDFMQLAQ